MVDLKNYYCELPFTYTELHTDKQTLCCPYWNTTNIQISENFLDNWFGEPAVEIRESMLDGTFKNCSTEFCPSLNTLVKTGAVTGPIKPIVEFKNQIYNKPKRIKLCFDVACNLRCPSCRLDIVPNTEERTKKSRLIFKKIEEAYSDELEEIFTSGTGDPFYSIPMREYLMNINSEKYPKLKNIILHTNGILWTPKVWDMMSNIHPYVKSCEISIDAASKETYEKVRLGGKWETLIENLKFINTIPTVEQVILSFVAQKENYKEMDIFCDMVNNIFQNKKVLIFFYKVANWGTFSNETYDEIKVWDETHSLNSDFKVEVEKLKKYKNVVHNFN